MSTLTQRTRSRFPGVNRFRSGIKKSVMSGRSVFSKGSAFAKRRMNNTSALTKRMKSLITPAGNNTRPLR